MNKRWLIPKTESPLAETFSRELGLSRPLALTLVRRGYRDTQAAERFLQPRLRQLADPFTMPDMNVAVTRITHALARRERIVIYGDYDVDGLTSSALLTRLLRAVGGEVAWFLPHRVDEGYGLSRDGIARCLRERAPQLLVAVDCGTNSTAEIHALREQGIDTIILDHHELSTALPGSVALVNPKRGNEEPLASVGIVFKLAHALLKTHRQWDLDLREYLDLVALGTVADVVPLVDDNRILVKKGLEQLARTNKTGLRALMNIAGVADPVTPYHIGFRLGPRLNAAGRLADASAALELLLTDDETRATELAERLHRQNAQRQQIEEQILQEALAQAEQQREARVLVLSHPDWHIGVIGIVAARVAQEFYRPCVVIGADGKGSCRSIPGFSIVAALNECAPLLERFGGHEMAAGLTVRPENVSNVCQRLNEIAARCLSEEDRIPTVTIDAVVRLAELDTEFFASLDKLEPCGPANPTPVFMVRDVHVRGAPRIVGGKHLRFAVTDGATTAAAIWFGGGQAALPSGAMDVAFTAELETFGGVPTVSLRVRDVRPATE